MEKTAYIKVTEISLGDYPCSDESELVLAVGPRNYFNEYQFQFPTKNRYNVQHYWKFPFNNEEHSSFVVVLYKHHVMGNGEIGEIELRLTAFQPNTVVSDIFTLHGPNVDWQPAKCRITVHVDENGAPPFSAPEGFEFDENAEIKHTHTYTSFHPHVFDFGKK